MAYCVLGIQGQPSRIDGLVRRIYKVMLAVSVLKERSMLCSRNRYLVHGHRLVSGRARL